MDPIIKAKVFNEYKAVRQERINFTKQLQLVTLEKIFKEIQTSQKLKNLTTQLRAISDEEEQRIFKTKNFPYFNLGTFRNDHRKNENLISTSFFIYDYDHLDNRLSAMIEDLKQDKSVFAYFVSPRGNGLKVIYRLEEPITDHKKYSILYKHYANIYKIDLGADPDKTSDASRACFFSYDPDMYVNIGAVPLEISMNNEIKETSINSCDIDKIENLSGTTQGNRTHQATQIIGKFIAKEMDRESTLGFMSIWNKQNTPPLPDEKIIYTVNDMYDRYEQKSKLLSVNFTEENNSYFKTVKKGKEFFTIMITSFIIIPRELLVMDHGDCLKCDVQSSQGNYYKDILIENIDWHTKQKFLKSLGHQDCVFLGSENDLQALCQFTQVSIPLRKTGTKVVGLHEDVWVVEGVNITHAGAEQDQRIVPYDKGCDAFYHKIKYKELSKAEHQCMIGIFYDQILNVNKPNKILAYLGWLFATPLKPKIENMMGAFPLLFVHGSHGSGKTSMSKIFARLVGYSDPTPNSVTLKTFPLLKMLSSTNAIPQWYDEFKVADMKENDVDNILRFMRKAYAGELESKGRADQTVENYKISAPMAVMGEWNINQPAIMERVLIIRLNDEIKKNVEMRRAFEIINDLELEGFMPKFIKYCLNINVTDLLQTAQAFVTDHFKSINVPPRVQNNMAVMVLGLELLREHAHKNKVVVPEVYYEQLLDDQLEELTGSKNGTVRSAVDQLIEELSIMAEKKRINETEDYKIVKLKNGTSFLAIKFMKVFREFKIYAKQTNYEGDLLDEFSYGKMFDDCSYVFQKNWPVKFDDKTCRCLCIDIEKAKEHGVVLEGFGYNGLHLVTSEL
ncbi:MAG: hypothetical protein NTZ27_05235 [Ignavibacteriales bacterium]|nr:hypothetical protein [Ignavibacteriales bacterium]